MGVENTNRLQRPHVYTKGLLANKINKLGWEAQLLDSVTENVVDGTTQKVYGSAIVNREQPMKPMETYDILKNAFDFFNEALFDGQLENCLILLHRHRNAFGYFHADRFAKNDSKQTVHEIALNPAHIRERKPRETFSTLVHEMVHQLQQERGTPPKGAYHNKQWAAMMKNVGLHPSDTGKPGGAETGRYVSHYIVTDGLFDRAFKDFEKLYDLTLLGDLPLGKREKGKTSKFKFACPECKQNAWAKITATLVCGDCDLQMEAA